MAKFNWIDITRADVIKAIEKFLASNPEYPEPRSTFLIYEGKKLPAKHIRGMAYQEHYGIPISKKDFGGGIETVRFFKRLDFEIDYHGSSNNELQKTKKEVKMTVKMPKVVKEAIQETKTSKSKIIIPSKGVIEQKNALQLILNQLFSGDIVCEKTYPWLETPKHIEGNYKKLFDALVSYRGDTAFAKKGVKLRCDFVCESQKLIIEYDERQHFSEARRLSLEAYNDIPVYYNRSLWIKACQSIKAKDNTPYNRDEIRAFYDSVRDIACYEQGYKLVRIMHGQIDFEGENALEEVRALLGVDMIHQNSESKKIVEELRKASSIKVAMYLQTDELKNKKAFEKIAPKMKEADVDIVVFPEYCYVPFIDKITNIDIALIEEQNIVFEECLKFSKELGKAVIICSYDKYDTIYSVFANAKPQEGETDVRLYI